MRYYFTPSRMAIEKGQSKISVGDYVEKLEPSHIVTGNFKLPDILENSLVF